MSPASPREVLAALLAADPAAPRVTYYDDTPGPTQGERIELSAKVLANWVSKAGNLLQEELDAGPGTTVALALPAAHWRTLYWALAAWSVGASLLVGEGCSQDADVVVTDDPRLLVGDGVLVTLAALARAAAVEVPAGAIDEARELSTYGDQLEPFDEADPDDLALRWPGGELTFRELATAPSPGVRVALGGDDVAAVLRSTLAVWAGSGSVVLVRGSDPATNADRLAAEGTQAV